MIRQTVRFFGELGQLSQVTTLTILVSPGTHTWEPDGQIRWCWLQRAGRQAEVHTFGLRGQVWPRKAGGLLGRARRQPATARRRGVGTPIAWSEKQGHGAITELFRRRIEECSGDRDG